MQANETILNIYNFVTFKFPLYFFPFGEKAYADIISNNITNVPTYEITYFILYRGVLHLVGAVLIAGLLHLLYKAHRKVELLGICLLEIGLLFQELYLHPMTLNQPVEKGMFDIFVWNLPIFYHLLSQKKKIVLK